MQHQGMCAVCVRYTAMILPRHWVDATLLVILT